MKCLHCGHCCVNYGVMIINPKYKDSYNPEDVSNFDIEDLALFKTTGIICPYLIWINDGYFCEVHKYPWYNSTPCFDFTQIESGNTECRVGRHLVDKTITSSSYDKFLKDTIEWKKSHQLS